MSNEPGSNILTGDNKCLGKASICSGHPGIVTRNLELECDVPGYSLGGKIGPIRSSNEGKVGKVPKKCFPIRLHELPNEEFQMFALQWV